MNDVYGMDRPEWDAYGLALCTCSNQLQPHDRMSVCPQPAGCSHVYKWSAVKAERQGGPPPVCRFCGQEVPR
jgi:hypothetical protein